MCSITKYSRYSYVIRGDKTKNLKEQLKKLGCKFSTRLSKGHNVGWVVPNKELNLVKELFNEHSIELKEEEEESELLSVVRNIEELELKIEEMNLKLKKMKLKKNKLEN